MMATRFRAGLMAVALIAGVTACGSDNSRTKAAGDTKPAAATSTSTTSTTAVPRSGTIAVTAKDYKFEGVPPVVASGATFTFHNASSTHMHEMVAVKIPATEHRSLAVLTQLSHAELVAALGRPPKFAFLQPPGGPLIKAVGDGTITEPGRYLLICSVQLDVTPAQYFKALAQHPGEAPEIPGGGAPHYTQGMYAEITVK